MKTQRILMTIFLTICMLVNSVTPVYALPPQPSSFWGSVLINGANPPAGTVVSAWVNDVQYSYSTVTLYEGTMYYTLDVPGDDTQEPGLQGGVEGDTIVFKVGELTANETGTWHSGTNVGLNLTAIQNFPPVITEGDSIGVTMSEDGAPTAFSLTLNATDANSDIITWSISDPADHGTATASGAGVSKVIGYAPTGNYNGSDSFVVQASDGNGGMDTIMVNVTIEAVNDAPVANDQNISTPANTPKDFTLSVSDVDSVSFTYALGDPAHGSLSGTAPNLTYTPDTNYSGSDSFTFSANDGAANSNTATVSITVAPLPTHAVTFMANGGTGTMAPQVANIPTALTLNAFTRTGYSFTGWNTQTGGGGTAYTNGQVYSFNTDLTLYAQWTANSYTVTFDANGGSTPAPTSKSVTYGSAYGTLATTSRTGYAFAGWFTSASGGTQVTPATTVNTAANHTLYAQWTANSYTVTFDANNGNTPVPTSKVVTFGSAYGTLAITNRTGYTFVGWFTAASGGTQVTEATLVSTASNHTLYAQWTTLPTHTATFMANGGTGTMALQVANVPTALTLNAFTRTGYSFTGWNTQPGGGGTSYTDGQVYSFNTDLTLYAQWTANTYTVTFNANGGSTPNPTSKVVTFDSAYGTLATTSRTGYSLVGWFTAASGGTQVTAATFVSTASNHILYAQWTANTYTVTFDANGGSTPNPTSKVVTFDSTYGTLATTSRTGYSLVGWFTAASGGTQVTAATLVSTASNHTLYAQWTANSYTVTFDANGGSTPVPTSKAVTYGSAYGTLATTSRTGYTFAGWFTSAGGGTQVTSATIVNTAAGHTLYAQWTVVPPTCYVLTLSHTGQGNNPVASPANSTGCPNGQYLAGESISLSGANPDTGWQISGWSGTTNNASTANINIATMPASAHTVSVIYTQIEYTLTVISAHGTVTKSPDKSTYHYGEEVTLSVTPDLGWLFVDWTPSLTGNKVTINGNTTVTANYSQIITHSLTVSVSPVGGGTTNPAVGVHSYAEGSVVNVTASPASGYRFDHWSGACTGTGACSITMNADKSVTANFVEDLDPNVLYLLAPDDGALVPTLRPVFDWSDVNGAIYYNIQVSRNNKFTKRIVNRKSVLSTYTPNHDLPAGTLLYWRVRIRTASGWGGWSEIRSFTTGTPPSIPLLLLPRNNSFITDYTPLFTWRVVRLATGTSFDHYQLQVDDDLLFGSPVIDADSAVEQYQALTDLDPNTRYFWRVRAFNTDGHYSSWSRAFSIRTAILPPALLTPVDGSAAGTLRPTLDWDVVDGAKGYTIQFSLSPTFNKRLLTASTVTSMYTLLRDLPAGTTIYWRVQAKPAKGSYGPSAWSEVFSFTTP